MSDQQPNGEDIARMLREQGPVQAPPDLADEVMRQVRAEPQERPKPARRFRLPKLGTVLVPALGLALVAALIVGIAHAPHGSSSSAGGGATEGISRAAGAAVAPAPLRHGVAERRFAIPAHSAKSLTVYGALTAAGSKKLDTTEPNAITKGKGYTLTLRGAPYNQALARLRWLANQRRPNEPTVVVILRRKP